MEVKASFTRVLVNGYRPAKQATIRLQNKLVNEDRQLSLGELREKNSPNKDRIAKAIRKFWHDSYAVEEFKDASANSADASYIISFSLSLRDSDSQKLENIVEKIIGEIQKSQ